MQRKQVVWIGMILGSILGGLIPNLWNPGMFSFSSFIFSALGAVLGIYIGFKTTS